MSNIEVKICRLCFTHITNERCDLLKDCFKMMIGIITPNLKCDISSLPVMCKDCSNFVQRAFYFKTNFFEVEEIIESKKEKYEIHNGNLSELMTGKQYKRSSKQINYCRTCLIKIEDKLFIDLKKNFGSQKNDILENCLFEMDSSLTADCKICLPCFDKLEEINKFKLSCMRNEDKIDSYLNKNPLQLNEKLDLNKIAYLKIKEEKNSEINFLNTKIKIKKIEELNNFMSDGNSQVISKNCDKLDKSQLKSATNKQKKNGNARNRNFMKRKVYDCPEKNCSFATSYKYSMPRHLRQVHGQEETIKKKRKNFFQCTQCDFSTRNNIETIKHLLSHANTDAYKCTRCSYTNNQKTELIRHIFSHVDDQSLNEYHTLDKERKEK